MAMAYFESCVAVKKIAILSPVHRRPDLLLMQLKNYNRFCNYGCFHFLHISREGVSNFSHDDIALLGALQNVVFTKYSNGTSWRSVIGALVACSELIDRDNFDYVYIHTDGDLIVSGDLQAHIFKHQLGYSSHPVKDAGSWVHYPMLLADERFAALRVDLSLSLDDIVFGRQEGSFFPINLWLAIISKISEYYDETFYEASSLHWPIEECVIPTLAKYFSNGAPRSSNVVRTKELVFPGGRDYPGNCIELDDLIHFASNAEEQCIALKWFSQDIHDAARLMVCKGQYE